MQLDNTYIVIKATTSGYDVIAAFDNVDCARNHCSWLKLNLNIDCYYMKVPYTSYGLDKND